VLAVYDVDTHGGSPYLFSELLKGGTLRQQMDRAALRCERRSIALQIAAGSPPHTRRESCIGP
jgi:hypothetical protein